MRIHRYRGFYDDDGSFQWRDFRRHLKSRWAVAIMRLDNRYQDARARLAGACNADLWNAEEGDFDGYSHWRCGKRRGHPLSHRFNNYTWEGPGTSPRYEPLPVRRVDDELPNQIIPFRKLTGGRRAVPSRRKSRIQAATRQLLHDNRLAQYRR